MSVTIQTGNSVAIQTGNRVIITAPGPQGPPGGGGGSGDVTGPSSSTDNAIARFNLATGKLIQNSGITIADGASGTLSGTNTGDQTIALTGDVTGSGTGTFAATIADDAVTFAKMQNISSEHLIGRHSSGSGDPQQVGLDGGLEFSGSNIRREALTGDVTAPAGSNTTTLANTAVTPGAYTRANVTVDSKGRITAAEDGAAIDLATEVTGTLDDAYIASADTWNAKLDANGDGSSLTGITAAQVGAIADGDTLATGLIFPITNGIRILDAAGDHALGINLEGELSANRGLTFAVNDANRQIDLSGNLTVSAAATVSGTNTGDQTVGTTAGTVAAGDDSRFTDARTPTAHASSHVTGGTDKIRDATASQDGLATATQIAKLDGIEAGANNYTLPTPTTTVIGGVKRNTGSAGQFVNGIDTDGSLQYGTPAGSGSGTVTSVAISGTDGIEVDSGSPITTDGTIQLGVNAATMKTTLDLTGTNSGDVTLAGAPDYITISGQTITRNAIDLTADVTGTLPIANGGTGQTTAVAAFDALAPTTTKGDLIVHNGTDNVRVPVGTDGHSLVADSTQASGVKWATGGGVVKQFLTASKNDTQSTTVILPSWTDITGLSITVTVGASDTVNIFGIIQVAGNYTQNACVVRLVRSGSPNVEINSGQSAGSRSPTGTANPFTSNNDIIFSVAHGGSDTPGAGTWTYKYQFSVSTGGVSGTSYINRSHNDTNSTFVPRAASFMYLIVN